MADAKPLTREELTQFRTDCDALGDHLLLSVAGLVATIDERDRVIAQLVALLGECRDTAVSFCDYGELAQKLDVALASAREVTG